MKIIVISNSEDTDNESEIATQLFEAGLKTFHLRKSRMSTSRMIEYLEHIPAQFHNRIFLHSHHELALNYNVKGVHLTENHKIKRWKTLLLIRFVQIKKPRLKITTSFSRLGELYESRHEYKYDYAFLNPVFDAITSRFQGGFTDHSLKAALSNTKWNIIARGGVTVDAIEKARDIGFKGLAFHRSFWESNDPVVEFRKIIHKFWELRIPIE